jgi:hypothetical protein
VPRLIRARESGLTLRHVELLLDDGDGGAEAGPLVRQAHQRGAELFRRMLVEAPPPRLTGRTPTRRLQQTATHLAALVTGSPSLAAAATRSLLGTDPDVDRLRLEIGQHWVELFKQAIDGPVRADVLATLAFAFSGALLQNGMGMLPDDELAPALERAVAVVMTGV